MGKLILCNGRQAQRPYYFKLTDTYVYSIEELCYYFYNNIEIITEDLFDYALAEWIRKDLELMDRADKFCELLDSKAGLRDYVVCILCSADYYSEAEIKQLLHSMDETENLTPLDKRKKKADNFMKYRQFTEAAMEYENILNSREAASLDSIQYGNLVHNLALALLNTIGLSAAADSFKEAYERNHNKESLKQYFYTLIMSRQEDRLKQEILNYGVSQDFAQQIQNELQLHYAKAEASEGHQVIESLLEYKDSGKIVQFYQMTDDLINQWKQEFRRENS